MFGNFGPKPNNSTHIVVRQTTVSPETQTGTLAYVPVGSFEQHGPDLPFNTDTLIAQGIAEALNRVSAGLTLPPVPVTCSHEHARWRGTTSVSPSTATTYITEIVETLIGNGFTRIVIVNGHGGNYFLSNVAQAVNVDTPRVLLFPTREARHLAYTEAGLSASPSEDFHAGEYETSLLLHFGLEIPQTGTQDLRPVQPTQLDLITLFGMPETNGGVCGKPQNATREKGEQILRSYQNSYREILCEWDTLLAR